MNTRLFTNAKKSLKGRRKEKKWFPHVQKNKHSAPHQVDGVDAEGVTGGGHAEQLSLWRGE